MNDYLATGASLVVILGFVAAWFRWARPKWRGVKSDVVAGRDALLGREAVHDSITGKQIAPALPGIGQRVASLEESTSFIGSALSKLADTHARLDDHAVRIKRLEAATDERTLARTESIELLRTIDTAFKAEKKDD